MTKIKFYQNKKLLAIISVVLMLGLVLGMGAFTYSKYVTSETIGNQTATAAKWGYVITVDAENLFGNEYKIDNNNNNTTTTVNGTGDVVVKADSSASKVVAPGTSGSMTINISGSAEVLAKLSFSGNATSEISLGDYKPIKWKVTKSKNENTSTDVYTGDYFNDLINKISDESSNDGIKLEINEQVNITYTISWEWSFEDSNIDNKNIKDTAIGYKANDKAYNDIKDNISEVGETEYSGITTELSFSLTVSIEQIQ